MDCKSFADNNDSFWPTYEARPSVLQAKLGLQDFTPAASPRQPPVSEPELPGEELTVEELGDLEEASNAAILQVYAALLIGFLVAPWPEACKEAAAALSSNSLAPIKNGIQHCLQFYKDAGAITVKTQQSLRRLLDTLAEVHL